MNNKKNVIQRSVSHVTNAIQNYGPPHKLRDTKYPNMKTLVIYVENVSQYLCNISKHRHEKHSNTNLRFNVIYMNNQKPKYLLIAKEHLAVANNSRSI